MLPSQAAEATPTFSLSPKQAHVRDLLASTALHCLVYGGSRSGKTFLLCYAIAVRAMSAPNSRHLIARLHNIDVRQAVMLDTWPKVMRLAFPGVAYTTNKSDQFVTLPNGAEVWFGGLDDKERVDKILGKEYATVYVNEASQVSYDTIVTLRTRLAQVCTKVNGKPLALKAYYDLNPTGRSHWSYREFVQGVRPENGLPLPAGERVHAVMNPTDNPLLAKEYLAILDALPQRQRQRFFEGQYLTEVPGALWPLETIEALRVSVAPDMARIVVAIDPSGSDGSGGDSQGIVVSGLGVDDHGYVLADRSCRMAPAGWARRAIEAFHEFDADMVVAEVNYGGAMVEAVMRGVDRNIPYKTVTASRGKHIRAEPVAALYEKGKVHHVCPAGEPNPFAALEEQMGMMTTAGYQGGGSPDRLDGLVWGLSELMVGKDQSGAAWLEMARIGEAKPAEEAPAIQYAPGSVEWAQAQGL